MNKQEAREFWNNPTDHLELTDVGDLHIGWLIERFAAERAKSRIETVIKAYDVCVTGKHFSRAKAFGEMHADGYIWVEKTDDPNVKVIIEERQSYKRAYILYDKKYKKEFHIRDLYCKWAYPTYRKIELKGITIANFRKQGWKHVCPNVPSARFNAFTYGDCRDAGYIASMDYWTDGLIEPKIDSATTYTLGALRCIEFWDYYLDNPKLLG